MPIDLWAISCIQAAESLIFCIQEGGVVHLTSEQATFDFRIDKDEVNYQELLGFDTFAWARALPHLAWLYIAIRTWGGKFILTPEHGLFVEQNPLTGVVLSLAVGPEAPDGCDITLVESEGAPQSQMYTVLEAMNGIWDLKQSNINPQTAVGWSLPDLYRSRHGSYYQDGGSESGYSLTNFRRFGTQPWSCNKIPGLDSTRYTLA
ncbi:MAG: hypothetical protein KDD55_00150 [Bdellovibrionales bacterium]|nr:hypothetical protein [Bdellovibrionales bacterium]